MSDHAVIFAETIWNEFLIKTHQSRMMSPAEWALVKRWLDAKIPLRVVLRGLMDASESKGRTLMYYAPAVEQEARRVAQAWGE